jgi:hypothetical protein
VCVCVCVCVCDLETSKGGDLGPGWVEPQAKDRLYSSNAAINYNTRL